MRCSGSLTLLVCQAPFWLFPKPTAQSAHFSARSWQKLIKSALPGSVSRDNPRYIAGISTFRPACVVLGVMKSNLLPLSRRKKRVSQPAAAAAAAAPWLWSRASTKDGGTAERRSTLGTLSAAGGSERRKVGYAVLYTILIGSVRRGFKGPFCHDCSFATRSRRPRWKNRDSCTSQLWDSASISRLLSDEWKEKFKIRHLGVCLRSNFSTGNVCKRQTLSLLEMS